MVEISDSDVSDSEDTEDESDSGSILPEMSKVTKIRRLDKLISAGITTWYLLCSIAVIRLGLVPLAEKFAGHTTSFNATLSLSFTGALTVTNAGTLFWGLKHRNENKRLRARNRDLERTARQGAPRKRTSRK